MAIVLVGPMGAGKTTLGKRIAKKHDLRFADTDRLVAAKHGAITRIFEKQGEAKFREYETQYLETALRDFDIVATGGGVVVTERNRDLLMGHQVIFLDTVAESVLGKINLDKRPLLKSDPASWQRIYDERLPLYEAVSQARIFTGNRPIKTLLRELEELALEH
jgi:shikimate kinase